MEANVQNFLKKAADVVGEYHRDDFYKINKSRFNDLDMKSNIEQLFYCAFNVLLVLNYICESELHGSPGHEYTTGVGVWPQQEIHGYKIGFLIDTQLKQSNNWVERRIIVECDSQEFNKQNEKEKRYRNKKDRYLTKLGYKVFHFTDKEITENPYLPAKEVLECLRKHNIEMP